MTQREADRIIAYRLLRSEACRARRDAIADAGGWGSYDFWRWHDAANAWQYRAERLMPRAARSVERGHFQDV
jgi:hypothetical protein